MRISDWSSDVCSSDLGTAFAELKELDFSSVQSKITETNSFEGVSEAIEFAESAVRHAFAERAKEEQAQFKSIGEYLAIRDEELQMLWWLLGQRSEPLNCPFSEEFGRESGREREGQ